MKASTRFFHWLPRVICILAILFVSLFALDAFSPEAPLLRQIAAFLLHLIPSFVLLAGLVAAWKWEKTGGIVFTFLGLAWSIFIFVFNFHRTHLFWKALVPALLLGVPFIAVGVLFVVSHRLKRGDRPAH